MPLLLGDEAHAETEGRAGRDARRVGDELDVDVLRRDRDGGGRGGARTEQSRDQAEPGDRPERQPRVPRPSSPAPRMPPSVAKRPASSSPSDRHASARRLTT